MERKDSKDIEMMLRIEKEQSSKLKEENKKLKELNEKYLKLLIKAEVKEIIEVQEEVKRR